MDQGSLTIYNRKGQQVASTNKNNGVSTHGDHCSFGIKNGEKRVAFFYSGRDSAPATGAAFQLAYEIQKDR